jgi:hypothetical protein
MGKPRLRPGQWPVNFAGKSMVFLWISPQKSSAATAPTGLEVFLQLLQEIKSHVPGIEKKSWTVMAMVVFLL